jgi:Tfp pilus assembly protein PilN
LSQQINLLPDDGRRARAPIPLLLPLLLGVAIAAVATVSVVVLSQRVDTLRADEGRLQVELNTLNEKITAAQRQLDARQTDLALKQQVSAVEAERVARENLLAVLDGGSLGETRGFSAAFRALARQSTSGLWLTGLSIEGKAMALKGRALNPELLPEYIRRLNQEDALEGHQFASLNIHRPPAESNLPFVEFNLASAGAAGTEEKP